jgi:BCD family chlorophyll transporter-like MFS transporter
MTALPASPALAPLGWLGIIRLGLVQTALGAIVMLTTSTINRVMVVELALPAVVPGALVAWHYALQILRPRWGFGTDNGRRSTPWIIGGMAVLAIGGALSAVATALMAASFWGGLLLAILAFTLVGVGVGAAGTSLLVLLAKRVRTEQKASAATIVWLMMIAGFAVTGITAGRFLDPFSAFRLVAVTAAVSLIAFCLASLAIAGVEGEGQAASAGSSQPKPPFRQAVREVWADPKARLFAIFVFISMLAYSAQDLILEPFAGAIFAMTPGASTKLSGIQHGGVFLGMVTVALACPILGKGRFGSPVAWTIGGCLASALAMLGLTLAGSIGPQWPIVENVFLLGVANGIYAGAAIGSMMTLATSGQTGREGTRMGVWGAAQAIAFGIGGFTGTVAADLARWLTGSPTTAYSIVFGGEAILFVAAALLALRVARLDSGRPREMSRDLLADDDVLSMATGR